MTEHHDMAREYRVDKHWVRRSFDAAAPHYESAAVLQREVGRRLLERLALVRIEPRLLIDAGAGTGELSAALAQRYPAARTILFDLAPAMLTVARRRASLLERWRRRRLYVCGDAERLPIASACADLIVSNLMLQWCNDLEGALRELRRALRPGGLLMFTTLGPDTLRELRAAWRAVDEDHVHVNAFIDMHDIGDALLRAGFADPVMDREDITLTYEAVPALLRELKTIGAHNNTGGRPRGLTGRSRLTGMIEAYERFRRDGRLPATYEVVHGHCWAPLTGKQEHDAVTGEIKVPLTRLTQR